MLHEPQTKLEFPSPSKDVPVGTSDSHYLRPAGAGHHEPYVIMEALVREYLTSSPCRN